MLGFVRTVVRSSKRLPEEIFGELVDVIFTSLPPVAFIGAILTAVGFLLAARNNDAALWILTALGAVVTVARILLIIAYRRSAGGDKARNVGLWERRYAIGAYSFSLLLGAFNLRAIAIGDPMVDMLVTSVMFGYGAGIVARLSVRPKICVVSLLLAVAPTVMGYLIDAAIAADDYATAVYAGQALLLVGFTAAGMEAMRHTYQTTLQHLLTQRDLAILAGQDALTRLPNRTLLCARFNEAMAQIRRSDKVLALHALDLDYFKSINDSLGHPAGDALLKLVAERLNGILRIGDTVARVGGDEFVVLQVGIRSSDEAKLLAHRIVRTLSAPYLLDGSELRIGVSIGIALAPNDGSAFDGLAASADAALYQAKRKGRGGILLASETSGRGHTATAA
jgi:diguanylate cyclase